MSELVALFEAHKAVTPRFKVVQASRREGGGSKAERSEQSGEGATEELKRRRKKTRREPDPREGRTVFVGNIPITCTKKQIKQLFRQYGCVETVRVRSMQVASGELPAVVAKRMHKQLAGNSFNAYIVFSSGADAEKALALDGVLMEGRHVRVDLAGRSKVHAQQRSVFVGNLPFTVDEEALREAFSDCGGVEAVRIVRDAKTGAGKGFGFVIFRERSGVLFALKRSNKVELEGRILRVFKSRDDPRTKGKQQKFEGRKSVKSGRVRKRRDTKPPRMEVRETRGPKPQRKAKMESSSEPRRAKPRHHSNVRKKDGEWKGGAKEVKFKQKQKLHRQMDSKRGTKKAH